MKTLGAKYILISSDSKKEVFLEWKKNNMYKTAMNTPLAAEPMKYMDRKNLISELRPQNIQQNTPNYRHETLKHIKTSASTNKIAPYIYANPQRQNATVSNFHSHRQSNKTLYRSRSLSKGINTIKQSGLPKKQLNSKQVKQKVMQSLKLKDGRIICIMTMRRSGLRFKLSHKFFVCSKNTLHKQFINSAKQQLFPAIPNKALYLFHLSKEPINNIPKDLDLKQYIIFGDLTPKFNLSFEMQMKLFEQASAIQDIIKKSMRECQKEIDERQFMGEGIQKVTYYGSELRRIKYEQHVRQNERLKQKYQWEKIGNVKDYVQKLINNPEMLAQANNNSVQKDQVQKWCSQNYIQTQTDNLALQDQPQTEQQKKQEKNPFFDIHTHYPKQTSNKIGLQATLERMQEREFTKNTHEVKHTSLENMMQKIKREKEKFVRLKAQEIEKIKMIGYKSEKQFLKVLDEKNSLLVKQNIPYVMEKYGITRAEAYNLYNLYKSLQKISAMRSFDKNQHVIVKEKGIDRETFDEGLKALEINPGEEVIRNICYFPQYITWQEFIKIISISLRKTTQSKLEAILQGIGSSSVGELSQNQISIMINSSLSKIFGKQQPQLRQHFVHVVMKNLDKNQSNTIDCTELKAHVLQSSPQNMDLISYLILNS